MAHDAGATNLILAWLKAWGGPVRAYMQGPAAKLWATSFPNVPICSSLKDALDGASSLVSGTGWASSLEHEARIYADKYGVRSVAVLDHWVNYTQRFERNGQVQWPDELWVADDWARRIALQLFPNVIVRQFENLYVKTQVAQVRPPLGQGTVLYLLEPLRQNWGSRVEGEFQALDFALEHMDLVCPNAEIILLRPHPSETPAKYADYLARDHRIRFDSSVEMSQALSLANVVMGVESFGLTLALAAGRTVYSSLPPWAPALRLPHTGIQQIRHLFSSTNLDLNE